MLMNQKEKRIMWTSIFAPILIVMGVALLVLGSLPIKNTIEDNTLTVNFVIGKKVIDITDALFLPVPDDVDKLQTLPGVGRKTANVVASVAFNKPAMAVDTHVFRVSARIGLTKNAKNPWC